MIKMKYNRIVIALSFFVLFLGACGNETTDSTGEVSSADTATATDKNVEIDFWHMYTDGVMAEEVLPELIAKFEEDNPHIKVNHLGTNFFDYWTKLNTAIAGNVAHD